MDGIAETPSANHMFTVIEYGYTLIGTQAYVFWNFVVKILFVRFRSRPNFKMSLDFLTTRVRNHDGDEYNKLVRMMHYIRETQGI